VSGEQSNTRKTRRIEIHDLLIAFSFIAMIMAPCIVAAFSGEGMEEEVA
jgi:hypothetical protein